jgi:hypothetical protein
MVAMPRIQARKRSWLSRLTLRREREPFRSPLLPSRDLPPPPHDPETDLTLPRSPEPLPDEALRFARRPDMPGPRPEIPATGAELRFLLEQVEERMTLRQAVEQAKDAQRRMMERMELAGGNKGSARPQLRLVARDQLPAAVDPRRDLDVALAEALDVLRRLSALSRH